MRISRDLARFSASGARRLQDAAPETAALLRSAAGRVRPAAPVDHDRVVLAGFTDWLAREIIARLPEFRRGFGPLGLRMETAGGGRHVLRTLSGVSNDRGPVSEWDAARYGLTTVVVDATRKFIPELSAQPRYSDLFARAREILQRLAEVETESSRAGVSVVYHDDLVLSVEAGFGAAARTIAYYNQVLSEAVAAAAPDAPVETVAAIADRSGQALVDMAVKCSTYFPAALNTLRQPPGPAPQLVETGILYASPFDRRHFCLVGPRGSEVQPGTSVSGAVFQLRMPVQDLPTNLGKTVGQLVAESAHIVCPAGIDGGATIRGFHEYLNRGREFRLLWKLDRAPDGRLAGLMDQARSARRGSTARPGNGAAGEARPGTGPARGGPGNGPPGPPRKGTGRSAGTRSRRPPRP